MVSPRRHFVPNPVPLSRPNPGLEYQPPFLVHTRYDGLNRRITKTISGTSRHFYYSQGWQVLEERLDASTDADRQYVWGLRYIDDLVLRDRDSDDDAETGDLGIADSGLDERLYALQDPNFNVVALAEPDGDIVERYRYTAYGKPTVLDADFSADGDGESDYDWHYLYTGRRLDNETGMYQYRFRYYHAELGRFVNRDPIEYAGRDPNLYRYVMDTPPNGVDPAGLDDAPTSVEIGVSTGVRPGVPPKPGTGPIWAGMPFYGQPMSGVGGIQGVCMRLGKCKCKDPKKGTPWSFDDNGKVKLDIWLYISQEATDRNLQPKRLWA